MTTTSQFRFEICISFKFLQRFVSFRLSSPLGDLPKLGPPNHVSSLDPLAPLTYSGRKTLAPLKKMPQINNLGKFIDIM